MLRLVFHNQVLTNWDDFHRTGGVDTGFRFALKGSRTKKSSVGSQCHIGKYAHPKECICIASDELRTCVMFL